MGLGSIHGVSSGTVVVDHDKCSAMIAKSSLALLSILAVFSITANVSAQKRTEKEENADRASYGLAPMTPVELAVFHRDLAILKRTVKNADGANRPCTTYWGMAPLHVVSEAGWVEGVEYLLSIGASPLVKTKKFGLTPRGLVEADLKTSRKYDPKGAVRMEKVLLLLREAEKSNYRK